MTGKPDVTIADLLRAGLLEAGAVLHHESGATATVEADGTLTVNGGTYRSPTTAHLAVSTTSRNGWRAWSLGERRGAGRLDDLRDRLRRSEAAAK